MIPTGNFSIEVKKGGHSHYLEGMPRRAVQSDAEHVARELSLFPELTLRGGRESVTRPFRVVVVNIAGNYVCAGYVNGEWVSDPMAEG